MQEIWSLKKVVLQKEKLKESVFKGIKKEIENEDKKTKSKN